MADIFKYPGGLTLCQDMEDVKGHVLPLQDPVQDPTVRLPDQHAKAKWPQHVVNLLRPRFGRNS